MASSRLASVLLLIIVGTASGCLWAPYYLLHPGCNPSSVKENVQCSALTPPVNVSDLYTYWGMHFNVMGSRYYFSRMAEALGYQCATDSTMLAEMVLVTPWSGIYGGIAIDGAYGFDRDILRRCTFPDANWPFLCTGSAGNPSTCGPLLRTLSYIPVLHDDVNNLWTLFAHCWDAQTPENPNSVPTATSWNVFSLNKTISPEDQTAILEKVQALGFDNVNFIQPNYTSQG